jgi:heme-degrading monooxygenase HmoA
MKEASAQFFVMGFVAGHGELTAITPLHLRCAEEESRERALQTRCRRAEQRVSVVEHVAGAHRSFEVAASKRLSLIAGVPMNQRTNRPPEVPVKSEPVTLVNLFKVPPGESEQFLERWKDNARVMIGQPGFIRLRLLRSLVDDAEMRYINVAEWASGADLERGYANPEWQASVQRLLKDPDLHVTAQPRVYEVAWELHPGDDLS